MSALHGFIDGRGAVDNPTAALRAMGGGVTIAAGSAHFASDTPPARDDAGHIIAVCAGNLVNCGDLRSALEARGHTFPAGSDSELVLRAYQAYGPAFCSHLHGAWAIALYNRGTDTLLLARDRAGEMPMFYSIQGGHVVFSTDLARVLAHPAIERVLDPVALQQYLLFGAVLNPRAIFRNVCKVPESCCLSIVRGVAQDPAPYWRYCFADPPEQRPEHEWADLIEATLHQAIENRLAGSSTPGVFLSGGVDSSLVTAMMCTLMPPRRVKTFSVKVEDPAYDESYWSRWASQILGTDHHEFTLTPDRMMDFADPVLNSLAEPMADSSLVPSHMVAKLTREHVPVVLAGDAGDELFGGYPKYFAHRWAERLQRVPPCLRRWLVEKPLSILPSPDSNVLLGHNKIAAFFRSLDEHYALRNLFWVSPFKPVDIPELLGCPMSPEALEPVLRRAREYVGPDDIVCKAQYIDFKTIMLDTFNMKVDRAAGLAGLAVREPFLDTTMIELAARIPSRLKVRGMRTKHILKKVAERYYPAKFVNRKKWGFGIPVKKLIRGTLRGWFAQVLSEDAVRGAGLVNPALCRRLFDEHCSGSHVHAAQLWNLFVLHVWHNNWMRRGAAPPSATHAV